MSLFWILKGTFERIMKKLEETIFTNGHKYELYKRDGDIAVYKQFDKKSDFLVGFEIFEVPTRPEEVVDGRLLPEREIYPASSTWGVTSFTLKNTASEEAINRRIETIKETIEHRVNRYENKR